MLSYLEQWNGDPGNSDGKTPCVPHRPHGARTSGSHPLIRVLAAIKTSQLSAGSTCRKERRLRPHAHRSLLGFNFGQQWLVAGPGSSDSACILSMFTAKQSFTF